ncbi:SNF2-related protein [Salipaludibacillus daqingensis]|uniref:SNF2-related protein n=1 Tax=Salipaludibacillus daqingensis TaxID=3041001 RepID=UPI00247303E3|nr:SNF2-related protein [Salipaludibacillus daqingensis]
MIRNKKDINYLDQEIQNTHGRFNKFSEDYYDNLIELSWKKLKREYVYETLKKLPIDTVTSLTKKLNLSSLYNQDINTLADVSHLSIAKLLRFPGIGEKSAQAIYYSAEQIKKSISKNTYPKINPENLSDQELHLLKSIYLKQYVLNHVNEAKENFLALHKLINEDILVAKKKLPYIFSIFQSKEKKEKINSAINQINHRFDMDKLNDFKETINHLDSYSPTDEEVISDFLVNNATYYALLEKIDGPINQKDVYGLTAEIVEKVNSFELNTDGLNITLRNYQEFGAKYGLTYKRTLLGDEMGLGKTIQAIAIINHLHHEEKKYALVVCPLSVLANWKREIQRFSILKTFIFHGNQREDSYNLWSKNGGIMITTYEHTKYLQGLDSQKLDVLIVDEAHYIKNPNAYRSKNVYRLAEIASYDLFMSGTPLENRLGEMSQLIDVLQPEITNEIFENMQLLEPQRFKEVIGPVYLRRNRSDVLKELPELNIISIWTEFGESELTNYIEAVKVEAIHDMRRAGWSGKTPKDSPKLKMLIELCDQAKDNGHKVLVFSFYKSTLQKVHTHLRDRAFEPITGSITNNKRQEIIDDFTKAPDGSVLINQIEAGGVGLNIQAASVNILCEPQWKPSTEEQAISRAYRMGQAKNVTVYRLFTEDSIDGRILELLNEKSDLFNLYARDSGVGDLSQNIHESQLAARAIKKEQERLQIST